MRFILAIGITLGVIVLVLVFASASTFVRSSLPLWQMWVTFLTVLAGSIAFVAAVYRYRRPGTDEALVRTGGGKPKITIGSGMWVNNIIHEVREISLNTMSIEIIRKAQDALITFDFNLADVECVFYVRVEISEESVLQASKSLGEKTITPETLRKLLEPKLDATLRSVVAQTEITDLVQNRQAFADNINEAIGENLLEENGLTLENVGIIRVSRTPLEGYDENDKLHAMGIREITEVTQALRVEKEKLIMEADVAIKTKELEARSEQLELDRQILELENEIMEVQREEIEVRKQLSELEESEEKWLTEEEKASLAELRESRTTHFKQKLDMLKEQMDKEASLILAREQQKIEELEQELAALETQPHDNQT